MSGGGGHIIIQQARIALTNPLVHGALPTQMQNCIDPILAKSDSDWTNTDKIVIGHALTWALCNL